MKIEPRGKYAGVKVHLDGDEAGELLEFFKSTSPAHKIKALPIPERFALKLGNKINNLIGEMPNLLEDRTEEQIKEALEGDQEKIEAQLAAMEKGKDWKKVK